MTHREIEFDFDIENYSIYDLESFFGLPDDYSVDTLDNKIRDMYNKFEKLDDEVIQHQLRIFVENAKKILTENFTKSKLTIAGSAAIIDPHKPPVTSFIQETFPTNIAPGILNKLKKKSTKISFAINTLYRDNITFSPSNCTITLPYTIKNVLNMKVSSLELPQTMYLISQANLSNQIYIKEDNTLLDGIVVIPDGNYTRTELETLLTTKINSVLGSGIRFNVSIDSNNYKTTISNTTNTFTFKLIGNNNIYRTLGWTLGYRLPVYQNADMYISESLFNNNPTDYLFLELNDYNLSNSSRLIGLFANSYLDKNIIAKIPYRYTTTNNFETLYVEGEKIISSDRQYFGPIHLQKMGIRLLNQYGEMADLNLRDYAFTLELEVLYDY